MPSHPPPPPSITLSVEKRVKELLDRLTLADKIAQMSQRNLEKLEVEKGVVTPESLEQLFGGSCAGIICVSPRDDLKTSVLKVNAAQEYLKRTKAAIPALVAGEALHGVVVRGATIFPQALALGATWSTDIVRELGAAIAAEASALGIVQCLSPCSTLRAIRAMAVSRNVLANVRTWWAASASRTSAACRASIPSRLSRPTR